MYIVHSLLSTAAIYKVRCGSMTIFGNKTKYKFPQIFARHIDIVKINKFQNFLCDILFNIFWGFKWDY